MKTFVYIFILLPLLTFTQTVESSKAAEKNYLTIETEVFYAVDGSGGVKIKNWNLTNLLVRYGLGMQTEINMAFSNVREKEFLKDNLDSNHHQFNHFKIGVIKNICDEKGITPELAFQINILFPLVDVHKEVQKMGFVTSLNLSNTLTEKWILNYNVGYIRDMDKTDKYFYIGNLQYVLNQNLVLFTENTGEYHGDFDWTQSVGFSYLYKDWSLEMNIGKGFLSPDFFVGGKIIYSLNVKKKAIN
ncbi:MAG TPA: hypothetical protein VFY09_06605 [Flavobacteriaceae bacterium]|nr:transporter [Flavobacteriaceae bacterium]HEX5743554.1 hypothetical protein [Flavobacteriaceae bacterium]